MIYLYEPWSYFEVVVAAPALFQKLSCSVGKSYLHHGLEWSRAFTRISGFCRLPFMLSFFFFSVGDYKGKGFYLGNRV